MQSADHHIVSDVEFPTLVQQRSLYVFLDDICFFGSIEVLLLLFQNSIELVKFVDHCYSLASIG